MSQIPTEADETFPLVSVDPNGEHATEGDALPSVNSDSQKSDGAGEPCPAPLVWQEIHVNYLQESTPWEITRGTHRMTGRTWGCGRPIYVLNNFAATAELFALTAWLLKDDFRCVMFDTVIEGPRTARNAKPTIDDFSKDLIAVANSMGDDQFFVFGASFGAAIGLQSVLSYPDRIEKLMLQHAFAQRRISIFERLLAAICLRSPKHLDDLPERRRFQSVNHKPWFPPFDDSRFEFLVESTGRLLLSDLAKRALAVNSFDVRSRLSEISRPILLLRTEGEGKIAAEAQNLLEKQLKFCEIQWMHSAGQHPYLTHPHRVAKLIRSFFGT